MLFNPIFFGAEPTLLRYTQEFDNAYWKTDVSGTGSTNSISVTPNLISAPNATLTADKLLCNSLNLCLLYENEIRVIAGQLYTISIYAKAGSSGFFQICGRTARFGLEVYANFDLINGTVTKKGTNTLAIIELDNNGWYRCAISGIATSRGVGAITFGLVANATSSRQDYAISSNEAYVWGVKIQEGGTATDYKNEFTQVFYSGASPVTPNISTTPAPPNLITEPETFDDSYWTKSGSGFSVSVTSNIVNDIYGNLTADQMTEPLTAGIPLLLESSISIINASSYVFSIYAKADTANCIQLLGRSGTFGSAVFANFNLSTGVVGTKGASVTSGITSVGGGYYRCWMIATSTATGTGGFSVSLTNNNASAVRGPSYTGTGKKLYIWGADFKNDTVLTDYVPVIAPIVSFGFGTDLHYGLIPNYAGRFPQDGFNKLTDAVNLWNTKSLNFAFINGDYIDAGHIAYTYERTQAEALVDLQNIETVYDNFIGTRYYSFGNHDTDKMSKATFIANTTMISKYYYFDVNGIRFIVLDATFLSDSDSADFDTGNQDPANHLTDYVPPTERTWLASTLSSATGKVIVFCHQSLHSDTDPLSVNNASIVRGIIETYGNVLAVITGHEHINLKTVINTIPYYSMNAMTAGAYPANAYAIIKVYASNVVKIIGYGSQTSYN